MRAIDADALLDRIHNPYEQAEVARWVNEMPTIEPERKTGEWKRVSADKYIPSASHVYRCSRCGDINWLISKFCPNCGAKMEGR